METIPTCCLSTEINLTVLAVIFSLTLTDRRLLIVTPCVLIHA